MWTDHIRIPALSMCGAEEDVSGPIPCVRQSRHGFTWDPQTDEPVETGIKAAA